MKYLIKFIDNKIKYDVYTGGNIHEIYSYLEMIGYTTTLTTSGHRFHHFGPLSSINNDTAYLQKVIAALVMKQKSIFECCGSILHKADACILFGPKFLPPSIRRNMNHFNALHGEEPNKPPRECKIQPP